MENVAAREKARAWREREGLSQRQAAALLRLPQSVVSAIERGARSISLEQALAYKREAGIDPSEWVESGEVPAAHGGDA
jgi:transcriptional regulator with XRE-family HTH domain